jgi:hypothetical protein
VADFDGDGDLDLYVTNASPGSGFFVNQGDGTFVNRADDFGVKADWAWGTGWADFDNDGWPDLLVTTGSAPHYLFRNLQGTAFEPSRLSTFDRSFSKNCVTAAFADYDNDGRIDVVLASTANDRPQLFHNETVTTSHWLSVKLEDVVDPIGAVVEVTTGTGAGARILKRELLGQTSHAAQNDRRLHFGLGDAAMVSLQVIWPYGPSQRFDSVAADQVLTIHRGDSTPVAMKVEPPKPYPKGCAAAGASAPGNPDGAAILLGLVVAALSLRRARR